MSSEPNETIVVCPNTDDEGTNLVDTFAIVFGVITILGSVVTHFLQQDRDRKDAAEAKIKEDEDIDRQQALERVREQLSVFIGPMHRLWKIQVTSWVHYINVSGHGYGHIPEMMEKKGHAFWTTLLREDFLDPFKEDPHSYDAVMYRNFIKRQIKPVYTKIRDLIVAHMSDLADMPTQEEWLERYTKADITSPHNGSMNINVIFDTFVVCTLEFDDIVESWEAGDFRRMQPTITVAHIICNDLIDLLFERAKAKEARYNNHVTVHKNTAQKTENNVLVDKYSLRALFNEDILAGAEVSQEMRKEGTAGDTSI